MSSTTHKPDTETAAALDVSDPRNLKIVLVHDWLVGMRGGEKALSALCECFPDASLKTLLYSPRGLSESITQRPIQSSMLQRLPMATTKYRYYLPLFPLIAELNRVKDVDVVISTSHAVAKSMVRRNTEGRPIHICYIFTPMRYIWDRFDDYFGAERVGKLRSRLLYRPVTEMLRRYDVATVSRVDQFVAISTFVADRVKKLYGRDSVVLPPPVEVDRFTATKRQPEDWYLVVSALVPYKRLDHAILACAALKRQLKIIGTGPDHKRLQALAHSTGAEVEFSGFVTDDDLPAYYARASALLFPGVEDFGIVPVEALAAGCPVIALNQGGVCESMTAKTATLYSDPTPDGLRGAIVQFESTAFDEEELRQRSLVFSKDKFISRFRILLNDTLAERGVG